MLCCKGEARGLQRPSPEGVECERRKRRRRRMRRSKCILNKPFKIKEVNEVYSTSLGRRGP
jgi:hypothetical protein